jgi:hypothetical protein
VILGLRGAHETARVRHLAQRRGGQSTRSAASEWVAAFVQRLRELGWIENRTVAIDYRWAEGRDEQFADIAAETAAVSLELIEGVVKSSVRSTSTASAPPAGYGLEAQVQHRRSVLPLTAPLSAQKQLTVQRNPGRRS